MKCVDPFVKAGEVFPCGKCLPCLFHRRRVWFHRILLEASQHDYSSVVTLTYDEAAIAADGSLSSDDLAGWLKRFRKRVWERYEWRRLRYYACGEYGERRGRPHFHCVLFGQPGCEAGRGGRDWCSGCECDTCQDISRSWCVGESSVDALTVRSASYVAGYVTRKMVGWSDGKKRAPFTRMSLVPGIGAGAMHDVASTMLQWKLGIPSSLGQRTGSLPLGRYLRGRLAELADEEIPEFIPSEGMQLVRRVAFDNSRSQKSLYAEIFGPYASALGQKEANRRVRLSTMSPLSTV